MTEEEKDNLIKTLFRLLAIRQPDMYQQREINILLRDVAPQFGIPYTLPEKKVKK